MIAAPAERHVPDFLAVAGLMTDRPAPPPLFGRPAVSPDQSSAGATAWQRSPAARFAHAVVVAAIALGAWASCRDRASSGTYALRAEGALAGRARGRVDAAALPLLSATEAGFGIDFTLAGAEGIPAGALRFHTRRLPPAGTYRAVGRVAGPQPAGTVTVSLATERRADREARDLWTPVGGSVRFARPRPWGDAISGAFRVRFARPEPGAADTVIISGVFATR